MPVHGRSAAQLTGQDRGLVYTPGVRSSILPRLTILLIALSLVLPFMATADGCTDCLQESAPGCCPPACSRCLCCVQSAPALPAAGQADLHPTSTDLTGEREAGRCLSADPRDILHVPKSSRA